MAEAEALADRVGILDRGELLCLEPADELKRRYGAETLEEAFFAATGRAFEDGEDEDDGEGGVRMSDGSQLDACRHELDRRSRGVVERNWYLVKRYAWWELAFFVWTVANTLTIVFIAKGVEAAGGRSTSNRADHDRC